MIPTFREAIDIQLDDHFVEIRYRRLPVVFPYWQDNLECMAD